MSVKPVVAVIGGGPAGLMAAGTAAACGATIMLFEKNAQCGRKLLITGAGRCNITNSAPFDRFVEQFAENRKFLFPAFKQFFVDDLKTLCQSYGLSWVLDDSGKYFPQTQQAQSVLDVLLAYCRDHGVDFHCSEAVRDIAHGEPGWMINTARGTYPADAVIMATGGLSYPRTGSDGDGYRMAVSQSHTLVPTRPALVALEIATPDCAPLSGISLRDVAVEFWQRSTDTSPRKIATQRGTLLFTHFGVSGPPVLFLSRWLPAELGKPSSTKYELIVDILPCLSQQQLEVEFLNIIAATPKRQLKTVLAKDFEIPQAVAAMLVASCGFDVDIPCQDITKAYRKQLLATLKTFRLSIVKTRGYHEAMVTAGGIAIQEINPRTLASKLQPGLFFAGEIIDVDGFTGGYNLQAAFSTGYLAGKSASI